MKYILLFFPIFSSFAQNVGIGTINPTAKLEVNGNIKCNQLLINQVDIFRFIDSSILVNTKPSLINANIICTGNSLVASGYPPLLQNNDTVKNILSIDTVYNKGIGGQTIFQMLTSIKSIDSLLQLTLNIVTVQEGTNSVKFHTCKEVYDSMRSYCLHFKNKGCKVVLFNVAHWVNYPPFNVQADTLNGMFAQDHSFADALVDVGNDPRLNDPKYFNQDGIHPNLEGQKVEMYLLIEQLLKL